MNIGNRIRTVRKYRNLILQKLGVLANIHFVRLGKFERGLEKPRKRVIKLAESLYDSYVLNQRSEDAVFLINLLIDLLTRRNDTDKLIEYLKIN